MRVPLCYLIRVAQASAHPSKGRVYPLTFPRHRGNMYTNLLQSLGRTKDKGVSRPLARFIGQAESIKGKKSLWDLHIYIYSPICLPSTLEAFNDLVERFWSPITCLRAVLFLPEA